MLPPSGVRERVMDKGIVVRVGIGDAYTVIAAEGLGYSPDLVHDMTARAVEALNGSLLTGIETGYIPIDEEYEEGEILPDGVEGEDDEEVTGGSEIWWIQ